MVAPSLYRSSHRGKFKFPVLISSFLDIALNLEHITFAIKLTKNKLNFCLLISSFLEITFSFYLFRLITSQTKKEYVMHLYVNDPHQLLRG